MNKKDLADIREVERTLTRTLRDNDELHDLQMMSGDYQKRITKLEKENDVNDFFDVILMLWIIALTIGVAILLWKVII